jgi:hypothetical protein
VYVLASPPDAGTTTPDWEAHRLPLGTLVGAVHDWHRHMSPRTSEAAVLHLITLLSAHLSASAGGPEPCLSPPTTYKQSLAPWHAALVEPVPWYFCGSCPPASGRTLFKALSSAAICPVCKYSAVPLKDGAAVEEGAEPAAGYAKPVTAAHIIPLRVVVQGRFANAAWRKLVGGLGSRQAHPTLLTDFTDGAVFARARAKLPEYFQVDTNLVAFLGADGVSMLPNGGWSSAKSAFLYTLSWCLPAGLRRLTENMDTFVFAPQEWEGHDQTQLDVALCAEFVRVFVAGVLVWDACSGAPVVVKIMLLAFLADGKARKNFLNAVQEGVTDYYRVWTFRFDAALNAAVAECFACLLPAGHPLRDADTPPVPPRKVLARRSPRPALCPILRCRDAGRALRATPIAGRALVRQGARGAGRPACGRARAPEGCEDGARPSAVQVRREGAAAVPRPAILRPAGPADGRPPAGRLPRADQHDQERHPPVARGQPPPHGPTAKWRPPDRHRPGGDSGGGPPDHLLLSQQPRRAAPPSRADEE